MYLWGLETKIVGREVSIIKTTFALVSFDVVKMCCENMAQKIHLFCRQSWRFLELWPRERLGKWQKGLLQDPWHSDLDLSSCLVSHLLQVSASCGQQSAHFQPTANQCCPGTLGTAEGQGTLQLWFSNLTGCQNSLEGFLNTDCWALLPEFLIQEALVGAENVYFC